MKLLNELFPLVRAALMFSLGASASLCVTGIWEEQPPDASVLQTALVIIAAVILHVDDRLGIRKEGRVGKT